MLELNHICKTYRGKPSVLSDVTFSVEEGKICGLLGVNGAGKSTLMKIMTGIEQADSGSFSCDGKPFAFGTYPRIGAMIESPAFYPNMTGLQNLKLLADLSGDCSEEQILQALKRVGMERQMNLLVRKYSMGMKQRLYLASALMRDIDVLILDEPFNGIDPVALFALENIIKEFAAQGKTVLISSHEIREIQSLVDTAVILNHGKIVYQCEDVSKTDLFSTFISVVGPDIAVL